MKTVSLLVATLLMVTSFTFAQLTPKLFTSQLLKQQCVSPHSFFCETFDTGIPSTWMKTKTSGKGWEFCDSICYSALDANFGTSVSYVNNDIRRYGVTVKSGSAKLVMYADKNLQSALITPAINCSDKKQVFLEFYSMYLGYVNRFEAHSDPLTASYNAVDNAVVRVSRNGINWKTYKVLSLEAQDIRHKFIDISDMAAGQSTVYVQFWREGNEDNAVWNIDDVMLTDVAPITQVYVLVDMRNEKISPNGIHVAHNLVDWKPDVTEMKPIGDSLYLAIIDVPVTTEFRFKIINGDSWGQNESVSPTCGIKNAAGYYDRGSTVTEGGTLYGPFCFSQCMSCDDRTPKSSYFYCPKDSNIIYCDNFESYEYNSKIADQGKGWTTQTAIKESTGYKADGGGRIVGYWNGYTNYDGVKALKIMENFYGDTTINTPLYNLNSPKTGKFEVKFKYFASSSSGNDVFAAMGFLDKYTPQDSAGSYSQIFFFNDAAFIFGDMGPSFLVPVPFGVWHDMSFMFDAGTKDIITTLDGNKINEATAPAGSSFIYFSLQGGNNGLFIDDFIYRRVPNNSLQILPTPPVVINDGIYKLLVEPNPASNRLTISIDTKNDDDWSARLINATGQIVFTKTGKYAGSFDVEVSDFPNGLYFVDYQNNTEKKVEKVLIQH